MDRDPTARRASAEAGSTAGIAFVGCGDTRASAARAQARRREVVVNGRRVKTVDVHAHCSVPEAMALMGRRSRQPALLMSDAADRIAGDGRAGHRRRGAQHQPVLVPGGPGRRARADPHPEREARRGLRGDIPSASSPSPPWRSQHPDLAAEQLEEGVKKYGLRGAAIGGSVNGEELADPKFHPFWAKAEQLGRAGLHPPAGHGRAGGRRAARLKGSGGLDNTIGNPLETTIALSHLIFEGTLDRFPGLKICAAHGGGYLPSYAARSDAICTTFPDRYTTPLKKKPTEYLRQLYFDSIVFTPGGAAPPGGRDRPAARSSWAPTIRSRGRRPPSTTSWARRA